MPKSFGQQVFDTVFDIVYALACYYIGRLVILLVSFGRWKCGPLEANGSEKQERGGRSNLRNCGLRYLRGQQACVTTAGVHFVGSLALLLVAGGGFLIWYFMASDRREAHFNAWIAVVILSVALFGIILHAIRK